MSLSLISSVFTTFLLSHGALTPGEEEQLLNMHNDARSSTAQGTMTCSGGTCPKGTITKMKWSTSLASDAQAYAQVLANTCSLDHASGISDGENLAWSFCSSTSCLNSVLGTCQPWIDDESPSFTYGSTSYNFAAIGHFTQIINSNTLLVGCGCADSATKCGYDFGGDSLTYYYSRNCVCRYSPAGNCGGCNPNQIAYPYTSVSQGCLDSNCPSGYSCDSNGLCDDGGDNGLSGSGSSNTELPTTTTSSSSGGGSSSGDGSNPSSVIITGFDNFSPLNNQVFNGNILSGYTRTSDSVPTYGPVVVFSYTFYIYFDTTYNQWVLTFSGIGSGSRTAYCNDIGQTIITSCTSWNDWNGASNIMVVSASSAYSSSSSDKSSKNRLIEGLLIGLGIALGVFIISVLVYWCVKRRNSKQTQYNIVEMNNEISNHEYVNMDN